MNDISTNVKLLREMHGISQAELARGICSQALISKIECGAITPDIEIMVKIAERFHLTVSQLIGQTNSGDIFSHVQKLIREFIDRRQYVKLKEYLNEIDYSMLTMKPDFKLWVDAIILNEVEGDTLDAINLLQRAIQLKEFDNIEQTVRIYTTLGGIYLTQKNFKKAVGCFIRAFDLQEEREIDNYIKRKLLYNMSIAYYELDEFYKSIFYAQLAVCSIIDADSMFLLDELHLILADNYISINKWEKAWDYIVRAEVIAMVKGNNGLLPYIEQTKNEISINVIK